MSDRGIAEWVVRGAHKAGKGLVWTLPICLVLILELQYYFKLSFNLSLLELEHHMLVFTFFSLLNYCHLLLLSEDELEL